MEFWDIFKRGKTRPDGAQYPRTGAIIVAAGVGERMGGNVNKQLIEIAGCPVIVRSIAAFEMAKTISEIVVVTSQDIIGTITDYIKTYSLEKVTGVIRGGDTRQQSVTLGLEIISSGCRYVTIHDGARPFATPELIDRVSIAAYGGAGAIAGIQASDTVKLVDENGYVEKTIDRNCLYQIQTPQTFSAMLYKRALKAAQLCGREYTDDSQLLESMGEKVKVVEGEQSNIKITTALDIPLGEIIAKRFGAG